MVLNYHETFRCSVYLSFPAPAYKHVLFADALAIFTSTLKPVYETLLKFLLTLTLCFPTSTRTPSQCALLSATNNSTIGPVSSSPNPKLKRLANLLATPLFPSFTTLQIRSFTSNAT